MGQSTISMAIFNCYVSSPEAIYYDQLHFVGYCNFPVHHESTEKHPIRFIPVFVSCVLSGTTAILRGTDEPVVLRKSPPFLGQVCHGIGTMGGRGGTKKTRHKWDEKHNPWWTKGWSSQIHSIIEASQILMVTSPYQPGFVSGIECKSLYEYFNTLVTSFARDIITRNLWVFAGPSKIRNDFHPISPVLDQISQVSLQILQVFLPFLKWGPIFPHFPWVFPWFRVFLHGFQPWQNQGISAVPCPGPVRSQAWRAALGRGHSLHLGRQPLRAAGKGAGAEGGERQVPRGHPYDDWMIWYPLVN